MLIGFKLSFGKLIEIDFTLTICYRNHIRIWKVMQDKWQVRQKVYYGEVCD